MARMRSLSLLIASVFVLSSGATAHSAVTVDGGSDTISGEATILLPSKVTKTPKASMLPAFKSSETVQVEAITSGKLQGVKLTFTNAPLEALGGKSSPLDGSSAEGATSIADKLPLTVTHEADEYIVRGDFKGYFLTKKQAAAKGVKFKKNEKLAGPTIDFTLTLPVDFTDVPAPMKGAVKGSTVTVNAATLKANPQFELRADASAVPVIPELKAKVITDPSYPIVKQTRNQIPIYVFSGMLIISIALILYGRFGSGDAATNYLKKKEAKRKASEAKKTNGKA